MPFIDASGIKGKLYVPDEKPGRVSKHDCEDCTSCMLCNDDKCNMCRDQMRCVVPNLDHTAD